MIVASLEVLNLFGDISMLAQPTPNDQNRYTRLPRTSFAIGRLTSNNAPQENLRPHRL